MPEVKDKLDKQERAKAWFRQARGLALEPKGDSGISGRSARVRAVVATGPSSGVFVGRGARPMKSRAVNTRTDLVGWLRDCARHMALEHRDNLRAVFPQLRTINKLAREILALGRQ
jgi:hypothetical protein